MRVFRGHAEVSAALERPILTIGNFDGIHLGHREIIGSVMERARREGGTSVVFTFRPHPQEVLGPAQEIQLLNTYDEKLEQLASLGVDVVIEEPFSREFSTVPAERFFNDVLLKRIGANVVYVGYDFAFGKDRGGGMDLLRELCQRNGVELHVAKPLKVGDEVCSSSRIRGYLEQGDVARANLLLGREFFYRGLVVRGNGRGRKIGFATANVQTERKVRIREGVYATWAVHAGKIYPSVTNVGRQPTFNADPNAPVVVETHILDFDRDIYGEVLEVRMVERLRDEVKFSGVDALVVQIGRDVAEARRILKS